MAEMSCRLTTFSFRLQGQTSSGKTYTMGTAQHGDDADDIQNEGIIPRAMSLLFETLDRTNAPNLSNGRSKLERKFRPLSVASALDDMRRNKSSIKVSFVEIYNEDLIDLLNPTPLSERPSVSIREDSKGQIYWSGVRELAVENTNDVLKYVQPPASCFWKETYTHSHANPISHVAFWNKVLAIVPQDRPI